MLTANADNTLSVGAVSRLGTTSGIYLATRDVNGLWGGGQIAVSQIEKYSLITALPDSGTNTLWITVIPLRKFRNPDVLLFRNCDCRSSYSDPQPTPTPEPRTNVDTDATG